MPDITPRGYKKPLGTEGYAIDIVNFNTQKNEDEHDTFLTKTGNGSDITVDFLVPEADEEIVSGSLLSKIIGLIKKKFGLVSQQLEQKADKYPKKSFTLAQLDNLSQALGITPKDGSVFGCLNQEPSSPYLFAGTWYSVTEYYYSSSYRVQIANGTYHSGYMKERKMMNGVWGQWVDYATTDKIDISSTLVNGWVIQATNYPLLAVKSGKMVNVFGTIKDGTITSGTKLFAVPWTPVNAINAKINKYTTDGASGVIRLFPSKDVQVQDFALPSSGTYIINFSYETSE